MRASRVQQSRHEVLAGARFAGNQHRRRARRDSIDYRQHRAQWRVPRKELRIGCGPPQARPKIQIVVREHALLPGALDQYLNFGHAIRLRDDVIRAQLPRRDGRLDRAGARDDDDLRWHRLLADLPQDFQPVDFWHHDVQQGHVKAFGAQRVEGRAPVAHDRDGETAHGHELLEDHAEIRLVFRNEHADRRRGIAGAERSRAHGAMPIRSETRKTAPAP